MKTPTEFVKILNKRIWRIIYTRQKRNYIYKILDTSYTFNKTQHEMIQLKYDNNPLYIRGGSCDEDLVNSILIGDKIGHQKIYPNMSLYDSAGIPLSPNTFYGEYYLVEDYLKKINKKEPVIIDLGANIGLFSRLIKRHFPHAKIIAVEPETDNYLFLTKNLSIYSDVTLLKKGIWDKNCELELYDRGTGNWGFAVRESHNPNANSITAVSLDELVKEFSEIDLIKMDIEGSELQIFSSLNLEWLNKCNALVIETHDHIHENSDKTVNDVMKKYGYNKTYYQENQFFIRNIS